MPPWRLLPAVVLLCPTLAAGAALRLCTGSQPHLPYIAPDGGGTLGRLVSRAARESGVELQFHPASLARCRAEIALGLLHGFPMTPYMPEALPYAAYPMQGALPDPARAVMRARIMLFRRVGAAASWDGTRFSGLRRPVLAGSNTVAVAHALAARGVPMDDNGKSLAINFAKMMGGRSDMTAGFEVEGRRLLTLPQFSGKIEMLPAPLLEGNYYLAVSKSYYARNRRQVEAIWDAIGRLNAGERLHQSAKTLEK